jgi:single-strand DNA-binding protein
MLNVVAIVGRLTADPELRTTSGGVSVCMFTVACDRNFVRQGEERKADFISVVAWRQAADFVCKYFKKGNWIAVNGTLQTRTYDDKNGVKRYVTEVSAENISFAGRNSDGKAGDVAKPFVPVAGGDDFAVIEDCDDLPF